MMRKALISLAGVLAFALGSSSASALTLTVGDAYYLGFVDPATPSDPTDEVAYINYLTTLSQGATLTDVDFPGPPPTTYTFSRVGSTIAGPLPNALLAGFVKNETGSPVVPDVTGFYYLFVKYGNVGHVWVLNGLSGAIDLLPTLGQGGGLSHWSLYQVASVPDGGTTLGLLGLAVLGLGLLRQRMV